MARARWQVHHSVLWVPLSAKRGEDRRIDRSENLGSWKERKRRHRSYPGRLANLVLLTCDLPAHARLVRTVLQAKVTVENPMLCFISYDEEHHRIAFIGMPATASAAARSASTMAFTYPSLDDLLRTYERLKRLGIEPYSPIHHGVTVSMYYAIPTATASSCRSMPWIDGGGQELYALGQLPQQSDWRHVRSEDRYVAIVPASRSRT